MTENEIKEYIADLRNKADVLRKSGFATNGVSNHFDKSADVIEELLSYRAIGTIEEFKALKEEVELYRNLDKTNFSDGYNKAIDEFADSIKTELDRFGVVNLDTCVLYDFIDRKAEQMKAGGENE